MPKKKYLNYSNFITHSKEQSPRIIEVGIPMKYKLIFDRVLPCQCNPACKTNRDRRLAVNTTILGRHWIAVRSFNGVMLEMLRLEKTKERRQFVMCDWLSYIFFVYIFNSKLHHGWLNKWGTFRVYPEVQSPIRTC